ncbi:MAG: LamG-like jellyroll fold domain-containing protein [Pseudomonadota bacterium]
MTLACGDGDEVDGDASTGGVFGSQVDTGGSGGAGLRGGSGGQDSSGSGGMTTPSGGKSSGGNVGTGGDDTPSSGGNSTSGEGGADDPGVDPGPGGSGGADSMGTGGMNAAGETDPGSAGAGGAGDEEPPEEPQGGAGGAGDEEPPEEPQGGAGGASEPDPEPDEPKGLVVHYAFDEGSGTTSEDKAGNFDDATLSGATWGAGRGGTSAVQLSADQAHVVLPTEIFETARKATIAVWVNASSLPGWSRIFDFNSAAGFLYLATDTGDNEGARFSIYTGDPLTESVLRTRAPFPIDVWKHVAITIDGEKHTMFVDGYPVHTIDTLRHPAELEPTLNGWLGKSTFDVDPFFKGLMDDFRVYDVVLSQSEIADLAWPDEDYTYLRMDETSGDTAADSSDRGFDGTLVGGPMFIADGHLGGALELAGGYVELDPEVVASCDDLTIALWAKIKTPQNWVRFFDLFGRWQGDGGDPPGNWIFFTPTADFGGVQHLHFAIFKGSDALVNAPYPEGTDLTEWHHYAVTLSGTTARLYFDGVQLAVNESMAFKPSDMELGPDAAAWLGKSTFPDPNLDGVLDDVRISCRAFTAGEIKQLATP